jgi:hypothetical protein
VELVFEKEAYSPFLREEPHRFGLSLIFTVYIDGAPLLPKHNKL